MGAATARVRAYSEVGIVSRVDGADPHQLVQIMFEEALADLARGVRAIETKDYAAKSKHLSHAATIVTALEASLDHASGGEVAGSLALVYKFVRQRILRGAARNDPAQIEAARSALGEILDAWRKIR
jgi:flagellar protein FliS